MVLGWCLCGAWVVLGWCLGEACGRDGVLVDGCFKGVCEALSWSPEWRLFERSRGSE